MNDIKKSIVPSVEECTNNDKFRQLIFECPIPNEERTSNLSLFIRRQQMSRITFFMSYTLSLIHISEPTRPY